MPWKERPITKSYTPGEMAGRLSTGPHQPQVKGTARWIVWGMEVIRRVIYAMGRQTDKNLMKTLKRVKGRHQGQHNGVAWGHWRERDHTADIRCMLLLRLFEFEGGFPIQACSQALWFPDRSQGKGEGALCLSIPPPCVHSLRWESLAQELFSRIFIVLTGCFSLLWEGKGCCGFCDQSSS